MYVYVLLLYLQLLRSYTQSAGCCYNEALRTFFGNRSVQSTHLLITCIRKPKPLIQLTTYNITLKYNIIIKKYCKIFT